MSHDLRPVRYGRWKRWADAYQGWRDGRAGIPQAPKSPGPVTTAHREALIRLAQDAFGREYVRYQTLSAPAHRTIMAERARLATAKLTLAAARAEIDRQAPDLSPADETRRRFGEAHQHEAVVLRRRRREHRELRASLQERVRLAQREVGDIEAEMNRAIEEAKQHHKAAATRVGRIHEHIHRRLAIYRRALVRAHDQGAWVNAALSVDDPRMPGWALPAVLARDHPRPQSAPPPGGEPVVQDDGLPPVPPASIIELRHTVTRFGSTDENTPDGTGFVRLSSLAAPWHFTLVKRAERLELTTREIAHGPFVAGAPVRTALLREGDYFDFGDFRYTMLDLDLLLREPLGHSSLVADRLNATTGDKPRLTNMSFVQREGSLLAILGPSGAGKSSLCLALLGELQLDSGRLFFGKMSLATHSRQIRDQLGFVPQDTRLHMSLTIDQTLRYGFDLRSPANGMREDRIREVLEQTDLKSRRHQLLCTLSGGELRRVSIALELLTRPPLLLLDEPTSGLDASMDREIMEILRQYAAQRKTVLVVTHNTEHLGTAGQIVVVVEGGAPVYSGSPRSIRKRLGFKVYADLMATLLDKEKRAPLAREYQRSGTPLEARREADLLQQQLDAGHAPPRKPGTQSLRNVRRQLGTLIARQTRILRARALKDNRPSRWQRARNTVVVALPLIIAFGSALLASAVAGAPGLTAKPGEGPTSLALLTTLCVLSGQALSYSDVVSEFEIIQREYRSGVRAIPVLTAKWLVNSAVAVMLAAVTTVGFDLLPDRAPQRSVLLAPSVDLFLGLAMLSVAAMTLGMLISALSSKLEHAVALVTATSIAQIALNGVTSDLSKPSLVSYLAAAFPDRWGLAATASSVDLRGIDLRASLVTNDALWTHTTGQWLTDMAALAFLCAIYFALAAWRLNSRLRPRRQA